MKDFVFNNPVFFVLLCLFIIEQIFYYFMGSYPYRYGFVITKLAFPSASEMMKTDNSQINCSLAIKVDSTKSEVYLHERHLFGAIGPLFFIGQITLDNGGTAFIKIGPLTGFFLLFLIFDSYKDMLSGVLIIIFLIFMYKRFFRNYKNITGTILIDS